MTSTQPRSKAAAFPILMRLPDLRTEAPAAASPVVDLPAHSEAASLPTADEPIALPAVELETAHREADVADEPEKSPSLEIAVETSVCPPADQPATIPEPVVETVVGLPADVSPAVEATEPEPVATEVAQPESAVEPVSRAEVRRQRARERQQQLISETPKRSWWHSHAPVIAVGFLLALVVTIFLARSNRGPDKGPQAGEDLQVPDLVIDIGAASDSPIVENSTPEPKPVLDSMAASPSVESAPEPRTSSPSLLAAKPEEPAVTSEPAETISLETTIATKPIAMDGFENYPLTDPLVHRPGGRPPRTARSPRTPQFPNTIPNWQ